MNWGIKISIVFSLFVAGMLFMVFKSVRQNIDLVVNDYYEQELRYQDVIDATLRADALNSTTHCKISNDSAFIFFPEEMKSISIKGEAWLYCIADKNKDYKKDFVTENGRLVFPVQPYNKGLHEVKISWQADGKFYYHKEKIFIQ